MNKAYICDTGVYFWFKGCSLEYFLEVIQNSLGFPREFNHHSKYLHREDGPAVVIGNNDFYWLNGEPYDFMDWIIATPFYTDAEKVELKLQYEI